MEETVKRLNSSVQIAYEEMSAVEEVKSSFDNYT